MDLQETNAIYRMAVKFRMRGNRADDLSFAYSNDENGPFTPFTGKPAPVLRAEDSVLEYTFPPVEARYWRIVGASYFSLFSEMRIDQWMLYMTANNPPVIKAKDATWTFALPFAPLAWQDVDDGSFDPDGDALTRTVVPDTFKQSDIGKQVPVLYTISDGMLSVSTSVFVTVVSPVALEGVSLVKDYSWLQLPTEEITPFVGSEITVDPMNMSGYTRAGAIDCFRWGTQMWNPSTGLTTAGQRDYWAGLLFSEPRNVHRVTVQVGVATGHAKVRRFRVEGSEDGTDFDEIGFYDFGAMVDISGNVFAPVTLDVTPGDYVAVRVRFNGHQGDTVDPDYTGNHDYGGPGLVLLEPFGDGLVAGESVNLANRDVFYSIVTSTLELPGTTAINSGSLLPDGSPERHRSQVPWDPETRYLQIDLGEAQAVWRTVLKFRSSSAVVANVFFAASTDGVTFAPVSGRSAPILHTNDDYGRYTAVEYTFPPVEARYWRITGVTYINDEFQVDQWMLYKTLNRAPVVKATDATWTVKLPVVSLPWNVLDHGSFDPDGDPLTYTVTPDTFRQSDIGKQVSVTYTVSDGKIPVSTNVFVTVVADASLKDLTLVRDYSWLQLPAGKVVASAGIVNDDLTEGRELGGNAHLFRWGQRGWSPSGDAVTGTDSAQSNHFAAVTFDAPRHVDRVRLHVGVGTPLAALHIDGTADGETWTPIYTRPDPLPPGDQRLLIPVESGLYRAIRLRLMAGDYAAGGYELHLLEPCGAGALPPEEINWANQPNFVTTMATLGVMHHPAANFVSGSLMNDDNITTGTNPGSFPAYPAAYAQVDLGEKRWCSSVAVLWSQYYGLSFNVYVSEEADGEDFAPVERPVLTSYCQRAMVLSFDPVRARRIRVTDAVEGWLCLFNEVMVGGCPKPVKGTVIIVR